MSDRARKQTFAKPFATPIRQVERALDDLRRGWPVMVIEGGNALVAIATESAQEKSLAELRALGGGALQLVVTAQRAAVLHIQPHDAAAAAIPVTEDDDIATMASLADATKDLAHPLRGPLSSVQAPEGAGAALALAKHARLLPSVFAAVPQPAGGQTAADLAREMDMLVVEAASIHRFEGAEAETLDTVTEARLPTTLAPQARLIAFRARDGRQEHLALVIGDPKPHDPVLLRLHSECFTGDILGSLRCDCGDQLKGAMTRMNAEGGILLYLRQEGRGIGLFNKLRAYHVQDDGFDTLDANLRLGFAADERLFRPAAQMLGKLGFGQVRLLTNNPDKVAGLEAAGITVTERVPHAFPAQAHNADYLRTKAKRSGHYLDLPLPDGPDE